MELGTSFLKSKLARRFCLLFMLCALAPTVVLIFLSYTQVVGQMEEQSFLRLKREVNTYGLSLFDRMIRIDNELNSMGRLLSVEQGEFLPLRDHYDKDFEELFIGVGLFFSGNPIQELYGTLNNELLQDLITEKNITDRKPFILTSSTSDSATRFFFGANIHRPGEVPFAIVAEIRPEYLWGIGPNLLLPPMTELSVYDSSGGSIVASQNGPTEQYRHLSMKQTSEDLRIFRFERNGKTHYAGQSNLFIESRFQKTDWNIILSKSRSDIMSAMDNFKQTYPLIILLFLLLVGYLSVLFIRRGLDPLERLIRGTKRIARKDFSALVDIRSGDEFEELGNSFNEMAVKLDKQFTTLNVLGEIDRAILSSLDRQKIIAGTLLRLKDFFRCEISILVKIPDPLGEHVTIYSMEGRRHDDPHRGYFPISAEDRQMFFTDQDSFIIKPGEESYGFLHSITQKQDINYLCLPLKVEQSINRVLLLGHKAEHRFSDDELSQARQIANQLAVGLANSLSVEKLDRLAKGTMEALARTVDAKSKWTSGHSERVAALSSHIGRAMGLTEKKVETLLRGGLLHDIGKIGIPLSILDKPGKLTESEYGDIKNHPQIGAKILEPIEAYQDIIPLVLQHHEKFDGTGYPAGLKGEEIDIRARIMAVADVWDALVSERPYREGWIAERARNLILESSGAHFDPDVVNVFFAVLKDAEKQPIYGEVL